MYPTKRFSLVVRVDGHDISDINSVGREVFGELLQVAEGGAIHGEYDIAGYGWHAQVVERNPGQTRAEYDAALGAYLRESAVDGFKRLPGAVLRSPLRHQCTFCNGERSAHEEHHQHLRSYAHVDCVQRAQGGAS